MKSVGWIIGLVVIAVVGWFAFTMIDVDQTQEAVLPEVSVEGGQMPEANVDVGSVDVGTEERTIEVPTIDVTTPEEEPAAAN